MEISLLYANINIIAATDLFLFFWFLFIIFFYFYISSAVLTRPTCKFSFLSEADFKSWTHAVTCGGAEKYNNVDVLQDTESSDDVD